MVKKRLGVSSGKAFRIAAIDPDRPKLGALRRIREIDKLFSYRIISIRPRQSIIVAAADHSMFLLTADSLAFGH